PTTVSFLSTFSPLPPHSTLFPYTTLFRSRICFHLVSSSFYIRLDLVVLLPADRLIFHPVSCMGQEGVFFRVVTYLKRRSCDNIRSEEHTSELQSRFDLVCRLLLEK